MSKQQGMTAQSVTQVKALPLVKVARFCHLNKKPRRLPGKNSQV